LSGERDDTGASADAGGGNGSQADSDRTPDDRPPVLLDAMLGKLATYLRMCGYDAAYALDRGVEADDRLLALAAEESRRLLTRDRVLAARTDDALLLESRAVDDQLRELRAAGFDLELADPPRRCGSCNGLLDPFPASTRRDEHAERDERPDYAPDEGPVWQCRDCERLFWRGSHWDDVATTLAAL
jgi:uncharacterized protein with PIN domain